MNSTPTWARCSFQGKEGHVVPDQLRTVDRERLVKRLSILQEMFAA
jgi:mRNA-degrading endonuclease toxin of MazEF toxin-antitoxin module